MFSRVALFLGALLAAIAVALGAFAAHGLPDALVNLGYEVESAKRSDWFETGVRYHLYHALGIICTVFMAEFWKQSRWPKIGTGLFVGGILLFSGSLYVMALASDSWRWLGAIVPLGGISMIAGWIAVAYGALRVNRST